MEWLLPERRGEERWLPRLALPIPRLRLEGHVVVTGLVAVVVQDEPSQASFCVPIVTTITVLVAGRVQQPKPSARD